MPFHVSSDTHADVLPIAFLLGHWQGNGQGAYPTIEGFTFGQEIAFTHDGRPFLHYFSRTWLLDDDGNEVRPLALETGFFRPKTDGALEVVLAHPTGFVEIYYGTVDGAKIEMATDAVARTESAKEYVAGQRLYGLVEGDLLWTFDMAAVGQPLQSHIWARLQRQ
ncbi:MAG: FABP family protein [Nocardioidaceae bacterium]